MKIKDRVTNCLGWLGFLARLLILAVLVVGLVIMLVATVYGMGKGWQWFCGQCGLFGRNLGRLAN